MLNVLKGLDYDSLCAHLISQFQNARTTPSQKELYNTIAFAGYEQKQKTNKQAHVANSRRTLFPRTRTDAQTQNVGGQEVMQPKTAGSKVAPQLTRLPSGGKRSRPRGHPRQGSLSMQMLPRKPRDPLRLQMFQSNWTHLWVVVSKMVTSHIPPNMWMRMM